MQMVSDKKNKYEKLQKQLFYMIPEKWDRVYLYASVVDHFNGLQTGEMFFYYFPKSIIKKKPINVYEIPNKFNIDEKDYAKLAQQLYYEIKKLRKEAIEAGEKAWTNLTIAIENFKFRVEYNYDSLQESKYSNYDRHLIWRYQYLGVPLSSYSKQERKMIEEYLKNKKNNSTIYEEGIYKRPVSNIIEYGRQENKEQQDYLRSDETIGIDLASIQKETKPIKRDCHADVEEEKQKNIKSQILNTN